MPGNNLNQPLVGVIPASGKASRIQPLPCSKELLPIGMQSMGAGQGIMALRPKSVSQYLMEMMHNAGARKAYIVLNRDKWDIPAYFGPGTQVDINLAYVVTDNPFGAPFSARQAFPFVQDATILFGFPDIRLTPVDAFNHLLERKSETGADIVLGLFKAEDPSKMDMVRFDRYGKIETVDIKPIKTTLTYTWIIAAWSPDFTNFMQTYLDEVEPTLVREWEENTRDNRTEYYVGHVIQAALTSGLMVDYVVFDKGSYIDIGTPESLFSAMAQTTSGEEKR